MSVTLPGGLAPALLGDRARIDHVVVLMFENQSYDRILGALHGADPRYDGLPHGAVVPQLLETGGDETIAVPIHHHGVLGAGWARTQPWRTDPDPSHVFSHTLVQCVGRKSPEAFAAIDHDPHAMRGFWCDYDDVMTAHGSPNPQRRRDPHAASDFLSPLGVGQLPAFHHLAQSYAVCTRWFGSLPAHTWLNRMFVHLGTSMGAVTEVDSVAHLFPQAPSIFGRLQAVGGVPDDRRWRIYKSLWSQALFYDDGSAGWQRGQVRSRAQLFADIAAGDLPRYTFIEPHHTGRRADYMHPPADIRRGDNFLAQVYDALRGNPALWARTLFVVTFDEHGGFYDHVTPAVAVPPDQHKSSRFDFRRYGVRVPAILASPWIAPGTVIDDPVDHTAILRLLHRRFGSAPLAARDQLGQDAFSTWSFLTAPAGDNHPAPFVHGHPGEELEAGRRLEAHDRANVSEILHAAGVLAPGQPLLPELTYEGAEELLAWVGREPGAAPPPPLIVARVRAAKPCLLDGEPEPARATRAFLDAADPVGTPPDKGVAAVVRPSPAWHPVPTGQWRALGRRLDITAPLGTPLTGMGPTIEYRARGYWGRLYATLLVIEDPGGERVALVAFDLHGASRYVLERLAAATADLGLGIERVFGFCTHTHQGPGTFYGNDWYDRISGYPNGFDFGYVEPLIVELTAALRGMLGAVAAAPPVRLGFGQHHCWGLTHNRSDVAFAANFGPVPPTAVGWKAPFWVQEARKRVEAAAPRINGLASAQDIPLVLRDETALGNHGYGSTRAAVDARVRTLWIETTQGAPVGGLAFFGATTTFLSDNAEICTGDVLGVAGMFVSRALQARLAAPAKVPFAFVGSGHGDACFVDPERDREAFRDQRWHARDWTKISAEIEAGTVVAGRLATATLHAWERARHDAGTTGRLDGGRLEVAFAEPDIAEAALAAAGPDRAGGGVNPSPAGQKLAAEAEMGEPAAAASEFEHYGLAAVDREGVTAGPVALQDPHSPMKLARHAVPGFVVTTIRGGTVEHAAPFATLRRLSLGGLHVATVPGEPSTWLSHRIEQAVDPAAPVLVAGIAGDYLGYFVTGWEYCTQQYEGASTLWGRASGDWLVERFAALQGVKRRFYAAPFATRVDPTPPRLDGPPSGAVAGPFRTLQLSRVTLDGQPWVRLDGMWTSTAAVAGAVDRRGAWIDVLLREGGAGGQVTSATVDNAVVDDAAWPSAVRLWAQPGEHCWRVRFRMYLPMQAAWAGQELGFALTARALPAVAQAALPHFAPVP